MLGSAVMTKLVSIDEGSGRPKPSSPIGLRVTSKDPGAPGKLPKSRVAPTSAPKLPPPRLRLPLVTTVIGHEVETFKKVFSGGRMEEVP